MIISIAEEYLTGLEITYELENSKETRDVCHNMNGYLTNSPDICEEDKPLKEAVEFSANESIKSISAAYSDSLHCLEITKNNGDCYLINSSYEKQFLEGKVYVKFELSDNETLAFINTGFLSKCKVNLKRENWKNGLYQILL